MCGIAGFCFTQDTCINARVLSRALLEAIEERGREATGYAEFDRDSGTINYNNAPIKASEFCKSRREYRLRADSRQVILHTRLATKGTINSPLNNHPVLAYTAEGQQVAAVHNGGVWNDDETFQTYGLPRFGEVDSEIIPAMIANFPTDFYAEIFGELEGGIATGWLDERQPGRLNLVRAWDSPMVVASLDLTDSLGSKIKGVIFASTVKALTKALESIGLSWSTPGVEQFEIGEGEHLTVTEGEWDRMVYPFRLPETFSRWNRKSNAASQGYGTAYAGYLGTTWDEDEWEAWNAHQRSTGTGWGTTDRTKVTPNTDPTGIGSGKVDSGKPSATYVADGHGSLVKVDPDTLTPLALDDSIGDSRDAYVSWWEKQDAVGFLVDAAERVLDDGYVPTASEMRVLAATSEIERAGLAIPNGLWRKWGDDFMWHMEACTGGNCCWEDPDCPTVADLRDPSAVERAKERWGFAALA